MGRRGFESKRKNLTEGERSLATKLAEYGSSDARLRLRVLEGLGDPEVKTAAALAKKCYAPAWTINNVVAGYELYGVPGALAGTWIAVNGKDPDLDKAIAEADALSEAYQQSLKGEEKASAKESAPAQRTVTARWVAKVTPGDYLVLDALKGTVSPERAEEVRELLDVLTDEKAVTVPGRLARALAGYTRLGVPGALLATRPPEDTELTLTLDEVPPETKYFLAAANSGDRLRAKPESADALCTEVTRDYLDGKRPRPSPGYLRAVALTRGLSVTAEEAGKALDELMRRGAGLAQDG